MSSQNLTNIESKHGKVFPKLFIGAAKTGFEQYIKKYNYNYSINYIVDKDDLINLIEQFSNYKNYKLPVIISDISFLSHKDQSLLLKFIDDTNLNIVLLASRDNILDTIISRVKEFRKFYINKNSNRAGFINVSKAREALSNENIDLTDLSYDDKLLIYNKYNPILAYDDLSVKNYNQNDRKKLLSILEYSNER